MDASSDSKHQEALALVASFRSRFHRLKAGFSAPEILDFSVDGAPVSVDVGDVPFPQDAASEPDSGGSLPVSPKLAFTPRNAPLHAYNEEIERLLGGLDGVDSGGNVAVRERRAFVIREVDAEARRLETWGRMVWMAQARRNDATTAAEERVHAALTSITSIQAAFGEVRAKFVAPSTLDFVVDEQDVIADASGVSLSSLDAPPHQADAEGRVPSLAFTPANGPLRKMHQDLASLLVQLDDIASGGDPTIKARRTSVVNAIEAEAERLERWTREVWLAKVQDHEDVSPSAERVQHAFYTLGALDGRFRQLKTTFTVPSRLDFNVGGNVVGVESAGSPLPAGTIAPEGYSGSSAAPPLAYTSTNVGLRRYIEDLERILGEFDAIESGGDQTIREKRTPLVRAVEAETRRLEQWSRDVWASRRERGRDSASPQPDDNRPLHLSLEELFFGIKKVIKYTRELPGGGTEAKELEISVLPGYKVGTKIRFPHAGNEPIAGHAQDLVLIVEELSHPRFIREGNNLITRVALAEHVQRGSLTKALDGRQIKIMALSGFVPEGSMTVVPGEGMPIRRDRAEVGRGDLIIRWDIGPAHPYIQPPPWYTEPHAAFTQQPYAPFSRPFAEYQQASTAPHQSHKQPHMSFPQPQTWPPHGYGESMPPQFSMPAPDSHASPPRVGARLIRKGFWNKRGDHLTQDGFVVHAPEHLAYPFELHEYPTADSGFVDHNAEFRRYDPNRRVHPDTMAWDQRPPMRTYESFIEWCEAPQWDSRFP